MFILRLRKTLEIENGNRVKWVIDRGALILQRV